MNHRPIGSEIEPAIFWIARYGDATRADEATAVVPVPDGRGELGEVDLTANLDIQPEQRGSYPWRANNPWVAGRAARHTK